ncbi:MAG: hypothetical protein A2V84_05560 [Chloroflexi bacterium RBG_16_70_13]|nr:MAG: hypothetical protein A2V84_05560 [Chloroflexi bacterium RBG_16_70_13]
MDPAVVVILAALIGAAASIAATALTMLWTARQAAIHQAREEAAALRTEKRSAYRDIIHALDAMKARATLQSGHRVGSPS